MDAKKIVSWLLLLFGEAIIITAFILFRRNTPDDVLILNIIISTLVYGLFFVDILVPWVDFNDKSQRRIGSLGLRWFITCFYAVLAITAMICMNVVYDYIFTTQLIVHLVLLFFLLLGLLGVANSSSNVKQVYEQESENRKGVIEMKNAMRKLKERMSDSDAMPRAFTERINTLDENLRYLSPSNNQEARESERLFIRMIDDIAYAVSDYSTNEEQLENSLKNLEKIYQNRKNSYSN
jgi:hypothetical protein